MTLRKILVAVDESEGAQRALQMAADIAVPNNEISLDMVYVVPIPLLDEDQTASFKDILDMMMADGKDILTQMKDGLRGGLSERTETYLLTGTNPATEIVKLTEQRGYDLVIIGNRGLNGIKEYLGSVSHKVLHSSPVSVLIAK